jgi:hypothetical protein
MEKVYNVETCRYGEIVINIQDDGGIKIDGLLAPTIGEMVQANDAESIWQMYKNYRSNDIVVRSGSGLCGVYEFDPKNPINRNYVESDTLHSTTVEELARNVFRFFPDLFTLKEQRRIINLLRYHDLGETVDCPDDGSRNRDEKFAEELKTFINKISSLYYDEQVQLIHDFIIFENANNECWSEDDKRIMQFAKLCDKADAPLGALLYEYQGRGGSLEYKKDRWGITDQDQKFADEIYEYSQAGIWTAHMIDTYLDYEYIDIFIEIIIEACRDVNGYCFPWMYEFCKKRGIKEELLDKML